MQASLTVEVKHKLDETQFRQLLDKLEDIVSDECVMQHLAQRAQRIAAHAKRLAAELTQLAQQ